MIYITFCRFIRMFYDARVSKNDRMIWNIAINIGIRSYEHIITYHNISNNCRIYSNPNFITNMRCSFSFSSVFFSYCNAFMNIHIIANYHFGINGYSVRMSHIKAIANFIVNRKLNSPSIC